MNKAEIRTVLLARPGEAREQLRAALEEVGLDLVLVADPLETEQAQVLSLAPHNLVIAMDAQVEDALERFDDLLALDNCRILFEEADLVAARVGWDIARWSRHLSAKLLGHGDVLPAGHEVDEPVAYRPSARDAQRDLFKPEAAEPAIAETVAAPVAQLQVEAEAQSQLAEVQPAEKVAEIVEAPVIEEAAQQAEVVPVEEPLVTEVLDNGQQAEALPDAQPDKPQTAVSDYNDYDDLDAFSFLDQGAIEAAMARDAEAEAIRKAEAEAEAACRAEAFAELDLAPQTPAEMDASFDSFMAQAEVSQAVPAADAPLQDDYDALDSLSFLAESGVEEAKADGTEIEPVLVQQAADTVQAEVEPGFESIDLGSWQIPAELEATSPAPEARVEHDRVEESTESAAAEAENALQNEFGHWDLSSLDMGSAEPVATATEVAPEPAASVADWDVYQDFEAISDLPIPDAAAIENLDSGYREALAPVEPSNLAHEEAYQRVEADLKQLDVSPPQDEWQDFERPTLAPDAGQDMSATASASAKVEKLFESVSQWSLSEISLTIDEGGKRPAFESRKEESQGSPEPELKFSSPSLAEMSGAINKSEPATVMHSEQQEGAVLLLGGIGGPDPLRQILQSLPPVFPVPVLVQQWLDGGHYDRLQRQMERVSKMPVMLAQPGMNAEHGKVYIVSPGIRLVADSSSQLRFVSAQGRDFANLLEALPGNSSVAVLLSGASEAFVDPLLRFQQSGGKLLAQSAEGCYDHSMPALMASRGARIDSPLGIASQLKAFWQSTELK